MKSFRRIGNSYVASRSILAKAKQDAVDVELLKKLKDLGVRNSEEVDEKYYRVILEQMYIPFLENASAGANKNLSHLFAPEKIKFQANPT